MLKTPPTQRFLKFKEANFLPASKLAKLKLDNIEHLQNATAEALFYFFSNQHEKISEDHINNVNLLFLAAENQIKSFKQPVKMFNSMQAAQLDELAVFKGNLKPLIAQCKQENFAESLIEPAINNNLSLRSPFSKNLAYCQESYEVMHGESEIIGKHSGMNCLRFTDGDKSFFILQFASSADGIYLPEQNILVELAHVGLKHVTFLQEKLIGNFAKVISYAKSANTFMGIIASHCGGPAHFYYENWPVLVAIYNHPELYQRIQRVIMRKYYNYNDLNLLFEHDHHLLLDSNEINNLAFNNNNWAFFVGTSRYLHSNNHCFDVADQYLVNKVLNSPAEIALTKFGEVKDCYPLVWIGVEGQKRCWIEQVEGYAYILNQLAKRFPNLGVIIDGWTAPFTPSEHSLNEAEKDRQLGMQIIKQLDPSITYSLLIGENSNTKIFVGSKIDFFITNFATGSIYVSRMLGKPGFCHLNGQLSTISLRQEVQIHPNKYVYLLPKNLVTDLDNNATSLSIESFKNIIFGRIKQLTQKKPVAKRPIPLGRISYSINKKSFYAFIEQRLDKVLGNNQANKAQLFIEPAFSISPEVRQYVKMATHGNMIKFFQTPRFPREPVDLSSLQGTNLRRYLVYGIFGYGAHLPLNIDANYSIWLREPLERFKRHLAFFAKDKNNKLKVNNINLILKANHKSLDNYYTRIVSGVDFAYGKCSEEIFKIALSNLKNFAFIGITEQQTASFNRLCEQMEWDRSLFPDQIPDRIQVEEHLFSELDMALANTLVKYDLQLYNSALAIIDSQKQALR